MSRSSTVPAGGSGFPMLSRRRFLGTLAGVGVSCLAVSLSVGCADQAVPRPDFALRYFSPYELEVVSRVADRIVPADDTLPAASTLAVARHADRLLAGLDPSVQADFHHLIGLFNGVPLLAGQLSPFLSQAPKGQDAYLAAWEDSPLALLRQGFSGLRRLCSAIYYASPGTWPQIHYAGPWIGRIDVGYGLDNQGDGPELNPNIYAKFPA